MHQRLGVFHNLSLRYGPSFRPIQQAYRKGRKFEAEQGGLNLPPKKSWVTWDVFVV